jgi:hypothetical protein
MRGDTMSLVARILTHTAAAALGFGLCYTSCVDHNYKVVQENGNLYVEDRETGYRQEVDNDFEEQKAKKDLVDKLRKAYEVLKDD